MATDRPRYTVSVDDELFNKIEDFRFTNRYNSRAEATVELIRRGLTATQQRRLRIKRRVSVKKFRNISQTQATAKPVAKPATKKGRKTI